VSRYLLPHEVVAVVIRRHSGVLLVPMADAVGAVAIALTLTGTLARSSSLKLVIWVPTAFLVGQLLWTAIDRPVDYLVITNERVLLTSGMLRRRVKMIPLGQLVNLNFERSFFGRLLGFGSLIDGSGGRDRVICDHVPYPEQVYLQICGMLFPASVDQSENGDTTLPPSAGTVA
jgi:Bacterial PH domain